MTSRRNFIKAGAFSVAGLLVGQHSFAVPGMPETTPYVCKRPLPGARNFTSKAVEEAIAATKKQIKDPKLAWMFENCFPNTLDTTC